MHRRVFQIAILLVLQWVMVLGSWAEPAMALTEEQKLLNEAWRIVNRSYVDDTFNHQNWRSIREQTIKAPLSDREQTYTAIQEMLANLDDPFTRLLKPEQYRSLQVNTSGELTGVGLQIAIDPQTNTLTVIAPIAGSPADKAGIQPLDRILKIDGTPTSELSLDEAATKMRGRAGTAVILTLGREGRESPQDIELVRDRIALNPVYAELQSGPENLPVGYIRLSQFSANATAEVSNAIDRLEKQGAAAYILDLRNNPGGLLQAGIEIARLWIDSGTIVYTVNRQGVLGSFDAYGQALTGDPLIVLVNKGTASASEIGLIQSLFDLSDGSGLAVTVAKYQTPNHTDIHKMGIAPDRVVPSESMTRDQIGTESDLQYQAALQLLKQKTVMARGIGQGA
ncbi:MAG: PDZ domain-containing protein [Oscillatoriales cyanobacterium]|nr:MAG: PDZ domain-containing protein [Oscillatoriales cyanobacterium]